MEGEKGMEVRYYICKHCGNIIAKVKDTGVPIVCCGEPMSEIIPARPTRRLKSTSPSGRWKTASSMSRSAPWSTPCCRSTTSNGYLSRPSRAISVRNCIPAKSRRSASLSARAMRSRRSTPTATSTVCGKRNSPS